MWFRKKKEPSALKEPTKCFVKCLLCDKPALWPHSDHCYHMFCQSHYDSWRIRELVGQGVLIDSGTMVSKLLGAK